MGSNNFYYLKWLVGVYSLMIITVMGCGGGSSSGNPPVAVVTGQAVLGPLAGAVVDVYQYDDLKSPIYSTTTSKSKSISEAGFFDIPEDILQDNMLYVVTFSGGMDIDLNDDGVIDAVPAKNQGVLHLAASGFQLKASDFKANILTDILYHKVSYLLYAQYPMETIQNEMGLYSKSLIKEDLNGDGNRDVSDLMLWDPVDGKTLVFQEWAFFEKCSSAIRNNQFFAEELSSVRRGFVGSANTSKPAECIYVSGNYAAVLEFTGQGPFHDGAYLQIIDISNPVNPFIVGSSDRMGGSFSFYETYDVTVKDNFIFAAINNELTVIDISDPSKPLMIGNLNLGSFVYEVAIADDYAYAAVGGSISGGLRIIDIKDPASPAVIGALDIPGKTHGLCISGSSAYLANDEFGLQLIDIRNPAEPVIIGAADTPGLAYRVKVVGTFAYVADGGAGLQIVDVSNSANPLIIGSVNLLAGASGVEISGDFAFIANSEWGPFDLDGTFQVINISNPANPFLVGAMDMPAYASEDLMVLGDYAYLAGSGLQIFDITLPDNPVITGAFDLPEAASGLDASGRQVFVADGGSGLQIIDISNPSNPVFSGSVDTPSIAYGVSVAGAYAYVTDLMNGLQIIDISRPGTPVIVGAVDAPRRSRDIAISGNYAYVADSGTGPGYGLQAIDINNPFNPFAAGHVDIPEGAGANGIAISGNHAYVACGNSGLQIIDIIDPMHPAVNMAINTPGYALDVKSANNYVYVADQSSGLQVIDINKPENPVILGAVDLPSNSRLIAISGNYAYMAGEVLGLQIVDIRDPSSPIVVANAYVPDKINDIAVSGNHVFIADAGARLYVYRAIPSE